MAYPFVESPNRTRTTGRVIDVVVLHTMEAPERGDTAEAVARWFQRPDVEVSAHYCVDADSIVQCVRERDIAWHARGGNERSIGVELAGYARQTAREWDDEYSRRLLLRGARLVASICRRHAIPVVWLTASRLRADARGITGHAQVSEAYGRSDHWDPGPSFPKTAFVELVSTAATPRPSGSGPRRPAGH